MAMRLVSAGSIPITDAKGNGTFMDVENESIRDKIKLLQKHNNWRNPCLLGLIFEHFYTWKYNGLSDLYSSTKIISTNPIPTLALDPQSNSKVTKITINLGLNNNHWTNSKAYANATTVSYFNMIQDVVLSTIG
jgi:hypothetical protein